MDNCFQWDTGVCLVLLDVVCLFVVIFKLSYKTGANIAHDGAPFASGQPISSIPGAVLFPRLSHPRRYSDSRNGTNSLGECTECTITQTYRYGHTT